jgi:hypothetical protein
MPHSVFERAPGHFPLPAVHIGQFIETGPSNRPWGERADLFLLNLAGQLLYTNALVEYVLWSLEDMLLSNVRDSRFAAITAKEYRSGYRYSQVV